MRAYYQMGHAKARAELDLLLRELQLSSVCAVFGLVIGWFILRNRKSPKEGLVLPIHGRACPYNVLRLMPFYPQNR